GGLQRDAVRPPRHETPAHLGRLAFTVPLHDDRNLLGRQYAVTARIVPVSTADTQGALGLGSLGEDVLAAHERQLERVQQEFNRLLVKSCTAVSRRELGSYRPEPRPSGRGFVISQATRSA